MKQTFFALTFTALVMTACSTNSQQQEQTATVFEEERLPGDSTLYGLACDGCTDSILIILPYAGSDPDTIDILQARINHKVLGRPDIGDELAIVVNPKDKSVADKVINLERLKGEWCYMVTPQLRAVPGAPAGKKAQLPADLPDSLRKKWFEPREYGIEIRRDYSARPIGVQRNTEDQQSPVEYPTLKRYRQWHIYNGMLVLNEMRRDTIGEQHVIGTDTVDIIMLRPDSLILRFEDKEQGYYRKKQDA